MFAYSEDSPSGLIYMVNAGSRRKGDTAGSLQPDGYWRVGGKNRRPAHHVVWELHNGTIPEGYEIDHIDRNRSNNLISNLRLVTRQQNNANRSFKRYSLHKGRYRVRVMRAGKRVTLGSYIKEEDAIA